MDQSQRDYLALLFKLAESLSDRQRLTNGELKQLKDANEALKRSVDTQVADLLKATDERVGRTLAAGKKYEELATIAAADLARLAQNQDREIKGVRAYAENEANKTLHRARELFDQRMAALNQLKPPKQGRKGNGIKAIRVEQAKDVDLAHVPEELRKSDWMVLITTMDDGTEMRAPFEVGNDWGPHLLRMRKRDRLVTTDAGSPNGVHHTSTNYSVAIDIGTVICDADCNVTLPIAANFEARKITVKALTSGSTVTSDGGAIDGFGVINVYPARSALEFISDGTDWFII